MKVSFSNNEEREQLYNDYISQNYYLLEEENTGEGDFLIFGTEPNPIKDIPLTKEQELGLKVSNLEQENFNIMLATTEMYEEQYNENLNLMLAITELYEMNMEV